MVIILAFLIGVVAAFFQPVIGIAVFGLVALAALTPRTRSLGLAGFLIAGGVVGCGPARMPALPPGLEGPGTPAPAESVRSALHVPGDSASLAAISPRDRAAVIAYASSLEFADSSRNHRPPDRYHGEWDLNLLDTLGTIGLVEPQEGMHRLTGRQLGWDSGRVELKITIVPSANHPVSEIVLDGTRLFAGVTYVWVDSLSFEGDSGTARALYIPADSTLPIQRRLLQVLRTPVPWNHAVARWTPMQCWDCVKQGWCHDGG